MITYTQLLKSEYVKGGFSCTIRNVLRSKKTVSGCMSRTLVHLSDILYQKPALFFCKTLENHLFVLRYIVETCHLLCFISLRNASIQNNKQSAQTIKTVNCKLYCITP